MNAPHHSPAEQDLPVLEISPALEHGSPTPFSTNWMPLDELLAHWTRFDPLLTPASDPSLLAAIGHALLALAGEMSALRCYTQAWHQQQGRVPGTQWQEQGRQTMRQLYEAQEQWYHTGHALESLLTTLDPHARERAERLLRMTSTQQQRLYWLTREVGKEVGTWHSQLDQHREADA
jgi:hypothetical protein